MCKDCFFKSERKTASGVTESYGGERPSVINWHESLQWSHMVHFLMQIKTESHTQPATEKNK